MIGALLVVLVSTGVAQAEETFATSQLTPDR